MESGKDKNKIAFGYDYLAGVLKKAVDRWTAESPRTARVITDVATGIGIAATVATLLPVSYPAWVFGLVSFSIALSAKFTVKPK